MERILVAATEEFAQHGIAGARVDRIAANAKANKQLIYHYYETKQGLYEAVMGRLVDAARARIDTDRASGSPYLESRQFSEVQDATRGLWARLQSWEGLTDATESPELDARRQENFRILREWIEEDQAAGRISTRLPADQVLALITFARVIPLAMPKVFRLILGVDDSLEVQEDWHDFIRDLLAPEPSPGASADQ